MAQYSSPRRAATPEHFRALCHLIGYPTLAEDEPTRERIPFEAGAVKTGVALQR